MKRLIIKYRTEQGFFSWSGRTFKSRYFAIITSSLEQISRALKYEFPGRTIVLLPE